MTHPPMKYKVEQLFSYGWDDAPWTVDDVPVSFATLEEAQAEIDEFIKDTEGAARDGYMESPYDRSEFRVVAL